MRKVLLVVFVLVATACSTSGDTVGSGTEAPPATTGGTASTTSDGSSGSTSTPPGETTTTSGRQTAPDFTLELGDGGTYTLSEGEKPVYMVFWAEW